MAYKERQYNRVYSMNLINYTCLDEKGEAISRGMGRTLDVSNNGILLETHVQLPENEKISLSIGLKDELIDIVGKVAYSQEGKEGKFHAGIEFEEADDVAMETLDAYILALE